MLLTIFEGNEAIAEENAIVGLISIVMVYKLMDDLPYPLRRH
jgi:hypothetical protein